MKVPATRDLLQMDEGLEVPEIRVWCHPRMRADFKEGEDGSDYFKIFNTFKSALEFIRRHPEAKKTPLVAFRGCELNLWEMKP